MKNAQRWQHDDRDLAQADLTLYRAQDRRVLQQQLYILKIPTDDRRLYTIGVTTRAIAQRVAEVERDLAQHFDSVEVSVLDTWAHRGNVELYFKHRYASRNYAIGSLTEYFQFGRRVERVWRDLQAIPPKVLHPDEQQLLAEGLSAETP